SGAPVVGATWALRLVFDGTSRTASHTVTEGETVADIARALAATVVLTAGADFSALANGNEVILVRRSAGGFSAQFLTEAAPFGDGVATSAVVTLSGTPAPGETWAVTVAGITYSELAIANDTVAAIATRIAGRINADTSSEGARFAAVGDDALLVIVNRAGTPFATAFGITRVSGANVEASTATSTVVTLGAGLASGTSTALVLIDAAGAATTFSFTAPAGGATAAVVAANLAGQIDALPAFIASSEGAQIVIVNPAGAQFSIGNSSTVSRAATATRVVFGGTVLAGAQWSLNLSHELPTVTSRTLGPVAAAAPAAVAAAFASAINGDGTLAADYTAMVEGDLLIIVKRSGGAFNTTATATSAGTAANGAVSTTAVQAFNVALTGALHNGDVWQLSVGGQTVTATIGATASITVVENGVAVSRNLVVDSLARVAEVLAAGVRGNASLGNFSAAARGDSLLIANRGTTVAVPTLAIAALPTVSPAATPAAFMVDLTGTPVTGDTWSVTLNSNVFTIVVGAGKNLGAGTVVVDTLDEIARALAIDISAGTGNFAATAEGARLVIAGPAGATLATNFAPLASSSGSFGSTSTGPSVVVASLTGTPVSNDVYRVDLNGVSILRSVG
ncbi:MAG: hypothetical protein ACOYOJ_21320, partial [Alsobacter sp.]